MAYQTVTFLLALMPPSEVTGILDQHREIFVKVPEDEVTGLTAYLREHDHIALNGIYQILQNIAKQH